MKKIILAIGVLGIFISSTAITSAAYFNNAPVSRCNISINGQLQTGSENDDVYTLQQFLVRAGYLNVSPNGYFGPSTRLAVKRFQSDNDLFATGQVGDSTMNALNERMCDTDVNANTLSYNDYGYSYSSGYSSGTTYVGAYDPYVRVISPSNTTPVVYTTPTTQSSGVTIATGHFDMGNTVSTFAPSTFTPAITPATSQSLLQSTNIVYNPSTGYSYGIVPKPGMLTISTPLANTVYNEGDTVYLSWTTDNFDASGYNILLENNVTGQSKIATFTSVNSASFVLTKALLDSVCVGVCDNNQQGSFRIVVTTPYTDIAGNTSNFRAAISPITIKRPYSGFSTVTINGSKNPVDSGEKFKLYINIPTVTSWNSYNYNVYSFKIHAVCPSSVQVVIAGVACGQDFSMPITNTNFQQEIPAMITNNTYFRQGVGFEVSVLDMNGAVIGTANTTVTSNAAPFNW